MPHLKRTIAVAAGSLLLAAFLFELLAAPGFLSDEDSTVSLRASSIQEPGR